MPFQVHVSPIPWQGDTQAWCATQPMKAENSHGDATPKIKKKGTQAFLGIVEYIGKFFPSIADTCNSLRKLRLLKTEWTWKATYQKILNEAKSIIEMDASGVGLGTTLLQTRNNTSCARDKSPDNSILRPIAFTSKSLTGAEKDTAI